MSDFQVRKNYLHTIDEILGLINDLHLPESFADDFSDLRADIQSRELLIPVIGHFSAGKSAMLNSLMNSAVLPVGIRPETTLATELRYSPSKNVTVYSSDDGKPHSFDFTEFREVISHPEKWLYVTLGLPYKTLLEIEPLILVDMPGFNSPIEQHSKAIRLYLERGAFYIVVIPADAGTIDRTILLQLNLLHGMDRSFAVFISKSDLKTAEEIENIKRHIEGILKEEFGLTCPVATINNRNVAEIMHALKSVDPDELFKSLYNDKVDGKVNSLICNIRTELNSLRRDNGNLTSTMNELRTSLQKFESKADDEIRHMREKYSGGMVDEIISRVGSVLSMSVDEIASIVISGDEKAAQERINSVIQTEILIQLKQKFGALSVSITTDLASSLKSLDATMKEFSIDCDFIKNICDSIQNILNLCDTGNSKKSNSDGVKASTLIALGSTMSAAATTATTMAAGSAGTILGFSISAAVPVIGAVVAALPLILTPIYQKYKKEELREEIITKLLAEVFPGIKRKLRAELMVQINAQIETMITKVKDEFEKALKQKEEAVSEAINFKQQEKDIIDNKIAALEKATEKLLKIMGRSGDINND